MTTANILQAIPKLSALVVGDICLDRWCTYDPAEAEPSRETSIPRIAVVSREVTAGAGGTVANNLAALGVGRVAVMGAIGDDGHGVELVSTLATHHIESGLCVRSGEIQTFTYTKLINKATGIEDQPRIDFINTTAIPAGVQATLVDRLEQAVADFNVILVADQAETAEGGVVTTAMRQRLAELAARHPEKIFFTDSRRRIGEFRRVIVKPNQQEAEAACRALFGCVDYRALRRHVEAPLLIVTHGPEGVLLVNERGETWVRTKPVEHPVDICGAGDSFSAGAAMALAVTKSAEEAARFGNLVASITIMKRGTGTASPAELLAAESA
jgi:rfaE bifunctional protein kinase chain/domain